MRKEVEFNATAAAINATRFGEILPLGQKVFGKFLMLIRIRQDFEPTWQQSVVPIERLLENVRTYYPNAF